MLLTICWFMYEKLLKDESEDTKGYCRIAIVLFIYLWAQRGEWLLWFNTRVGNSSCLMQRVHTRFLVLVLCACLEIVFTPFVLFPLAVVLSVLLRYTDSDYPFGINIFYWYNRHIQWKKHTTPYVLDTTIHKQTQIS
jgi:hypothetical protein